MLALGHLIIGGVLDAFPNLRFAFLETGVGWVPYYMDRLDSAYTNFGTTDRLLKKQPSDYVRSPQLFYAADPEEPMLDAIAEEIGSQGLVIGSDYCHPEGMCPETIRALAGRTDITDELKKGILSDNPARLYGL